MGWETRERGGLYYTRSRREGGKVVREYIGGGERGALVAEMYAMARAGSQMTRASKRLAHLESEELLGQVRAFCADVEAVLRAVLCAAGYHQHHRGQWRKRRGPEVNRTPEGETKAMGRTTNALAEELPLVQKARRLQNAKNAPPLALEGEPPAGETKGELSKPTVDVKALFQRAQNGDISTRADVRQTLIEYQKYKPEGFIPLPSLVTNALLKKMCGENVLYEEDWRLQVTRMSRDLGGPHPSPLESLLAERISLCWLWLHYAEAAYAQHLGTLNMEQSAFHEKRIEGAMRRYLAAVKALAQVRKMQLPTVQFNVGQNQINVGSSPSATRRS